MKEHEGGGRSILHINLILYSTESSICRDLIVTNLINTREYCTYISYLIRSAAYSSLFKRQD